MPFTEKDIEDIKIDYRSYRDNLDTNTLPLIEFKFYNKKNGFINGDKLNKIEKKAILSNESQIWSTEYFLENRIYFKISYDDVKNKSEISMCELPVTFSLKKFNEIKTIVGGTIFFKNKITSDFKNILINSKIKCTYEKDNSYIFKDENDFINFILYKSTDKIFEDYKHYDKKPLVDAYILLFNEEINNEHLNHENYIIDYAYNQEIHEIIKVTEKRILDKNIRVAFCAEHDRYESTYYFLVIPETQNEYLYIDEGKFFLYYHNKRYFFDNNIIRKNHEGKYIIELETYRSIQNNITELLASDEFIITHNIYNFYKNNRVIGKFNTRNLTEREFAIHKRYKQLLSQGKTIKIDNIKISLKIIELDNGQMKIQFTKGFLDVHNKFDNVRQALNIENAQYNYNTIYENILNLSSLNFEKQKTKISRKRRRKNRLPETYYQSGDFVGTGFKINNIQIKVYKKGNRVYLNDICVRLSDIYDICTKAICYNNVEDFNKYVKDVSAIGTIWKKMINNGVQIKLTNPFSGKFKIVNKDGSNHENIILRFSLLWDTEKRRNVYLLLNGTKYLINNKVKFKKYFNIPSKITSIDNLGIELNQCIKELDESKMFEIVDNAIEEAKIVRKRGQELVESTIRDINALLIEEDINGNKIIGYKFNGRLSKIPYFIEANNLKVYKFVNGRWNMRCVVDDHTKQRIFEDRLANRLVNIYNEPSFIHTLHNI